MITVERNSEIKLLEILKGMRNHADSVCAAHFLFSKLNSKYKSKPQIKIAINIIREVFGESDGCVFLCSDFDIILIFPVNSKELFDKVVYQLRYLFIEDPLTNGNRYEPQFFVFYDLGLQFDKFLAVCKDKVEIYERFSDAPDYNRDVLNFNNTLSQLDISPMIYTQSVCAIPQHTKQSLPILDVIDVNIEKLHSFLKLPEDLEINGLISKYCLERVEEKVIAFVLSKPSYYFSRSIGFCLSPRIILSEAFLKLCEQIKSGAKRLSVVVEIDIIHAVSNFNLFVKARDLLNKLEFKICITNMNYMTFTQLNRFELNADLIKLVWDKQFASVKLAETMQRAVTASGSNRIILTKCDTPESIRAGHFLGISLFQGKSV